MRVAAGAGDPILPSEDVRLALLPNISGDAGLQDNRTNTHWYENCLTDKA